MKKIFLLSSILFSFVYSSCTNSKTAKEQLASDLLESETFKNYIGFCVHLGKGMKSNRYNTGGIDKQYIKAHFNGNLHILPKTTLYAIYSTAKMTNAKDYIDTQLKIDSTYQVLLQEFPFLNEMSSLERIRFLITARRQLSDFKSK